MHATLLVPAPLSAISGGYGYDRRMLAEWRAAGHGVAVRELGDARAAWAAAEGVPVIDGLGLPAFADLAPEFAARGAVGLIHHPVSMEAGLSEAERAGLRAAEERCLRLLPAIVTTSETTAATLSEGFGVAADRITVVVPGTDPAPRSPGGGTAPCHILSVGSLIPRKGHDVLMRALARLFDLDWYLTIAGGPAGGTHARGLAALAEELGVAARVTFAGEVTGGALDALWQAADLFALATHYEGYGMAIAEALKRGLPCAVTAGGAAGKLVPAAAGAVCEPGDVVTLSKSLRRMIFDTDLRRDMAEAAWQAGEGLPGWAAQAALFADAISRSAP